MWLVLLCKPTAYTQIFPLCMDILSVEGSIEKDKCEKFSLDKKSYERLFDFTIECITEYIKNKKIGKKLPVGFTFPFAEKHESLTSGKLIHWTRDFKATGGEGEDVVQPIKKAASDEIKVGIRNRLQLLY